MNAANTSVADPAARPSIPSVRLTAFDAPTITTTATTNHTHSPRFRSSWRVKESRVETSIQRSA